MKKLEFLKHGFGPQSLIERKAMKMKFYSNGNPPPRDFEINDGKNITNPDPGLSLKEMVKRYVLGSEQLTGNNNFYFDSEDDEDPDDSLAVESGVDLSDVTVALKNVELARSREDDIKAAIAAKRSVKKVAKASVESQNEDRPGGTDKKADTGQRSDAKDKRGTSEDER